MEEFFAGLALVTIGALATAAIKYPKGYNRLYWPLLGLSWLASALVTAHWVGYSQGAMSLYPYLDATRRLEAYDASEVGALPIDWIIGGVFAFNLFIVLFSAMPTILGISDKDRKQSDGKDEGHPPS